MCRVDLNCDLGESFGNYTIGLDEEVIPYISSANVACGWHASDPVVMEQTVDRAQKYGTAIGAHPGFFDLMGFGRRPMRITPAEAKVYVQYQIGALYAFCRAKKIPLSHVKPHGALYNMAGNDFSLAMGICEGIAEFDENLILLALSGSQMIEAAKKVGLPYAREVFADRAYEKDGSLVDRKKEGAVITDQKEAVRRAVRMITEGKVVAITGEEIAIKADSICVHGDNAAALAFVREIRDALEEQNVTIAPISQVIGLK